MLTAILPGLLLLIADRITKIFLDGMSAPLLPGVIALHGVRNTGMALGLMNGKTAAALLLSLAAILALVLLLRKTRVRGMARVGLSLMAGGALGNLIDRLFLGSVIDLFELLFVDFYIFNVADAGVVIGAVLCVLSLLFRPQEWGKE